MIIPKFGFEEEFKSLQEKKNSLESEKEAAIEEAIEAINLRFKERGDLINKLFSLVSEEVPPTEVYENETKDEKAEEQAEEAEVNFTEGSVDEVPAEREVQQEVVRPITTVRI